MTVLPAPSVLRPAWWDDMNDRAMLICRISDRKQLDGVSLDAQRHHQEAYAASVGLRVVATASFQESAKRSKMRAQFHAAIQQAAVQKIKHLVFYVWDRIARNSTDAEMLEELIREGEVCLHLATGGTVLHRDSDDSDFFLLDINIAQAKQENRGRRRKTIDGMEQRCRNGWYPSRPPTFYKQVPVLDVDGRPKRRGSTVVGPTPEGRRLLRRQMELHLAGYSLDRIRESCLKECLVPVSLIPGYHRGLIDRHLKTDFYAALRNPHDGFISQFTWRDIIYEGKHEPIYTADEWERLQASFGLKSKYRKLKHDGLFAQGPLTLACGDSACGCKVTYAPKKKPSGREYNYYRCADGKRTHVMRGEKQINVEERDILEQLGAAVRRIALTPEVAEAIARGLNETHCAAMKAGERDADVQKATLAALAEKEDRLFDRYDGGEIDRETYDRQLSRLRTEKAAALTKVSEGNGDAKYLVTAARVLELAKNAKLLFDGRNPREKLDLLQRLVCNPRLEGRTVRYDLRKPFDTLAKMRGDEGWRPQRDSNRPTAISKTRCGTWTWLSSPRNREGRFGPVGAA
jgi:DNA invertase Pin-like site-specific DNA recombinase